MDISCGGAGGGYFWASYSNKGDSFMLPPRCYQTSNTNETNSNLKYWKKDQFVKYVHDWKIPPKAEEVAYHLRSYCHYTVCLCYDVDSYDFIRFD